MASFQAQYGIRLSREASSMSWQEFKDLLAGLGPDTPLGRIVGIRLEDDEEILKYFNKDQSRIRTEWQNRIAANRSEQETAEFISSIQDALMKMAGGDKH